MTQHLKYGGSVAARDIGCHGWRKLAAQMPVKDFGGSNPAADEGNMLHDGMETLYGKRYPDVTPAMLLAEGLEYNGIKLTEDLIAEKLIPAILALEKLLDTYDIIDWEVEPFIQMDEDIGGSIDLIGVSGCGKKVLIVDYKFGFNSVNVTDNPQLLFYGMVATVDAKTRAFFDKAEEIILAIIQPNDDGDDYDTQVIDLTALDAFENKYFDALDASDAKDAPVNAGGHCKYCPALTICPIKTGKVLEATRASEIVAGNLAEYLPLAEQVVEWAKEVQKVAYEQLQLGTPIEGYKLVAKRASRVWNNVEAVEDIIRKAKKIKLAEGFDMKLKSPAQLEKVCKQKGVDFKTYAEYISSVSSGSTLAKQSDKRPALLPVQGLAQLNQMND